MMYFCYFLIWTFVIYVSHRLAHIIPLIRNVHFGHHKYIKENLSPKWKWNNILLFQDNWISTLDVLITEFIPTFIFCIVTEQWWILITYYFWSAFIQENIEHNRNFDWYPWLTSGKWHMIHHDTNHYNFGLFTSLWDKIFNSFQSHK